VQQVAPATPQSPSSAHVPEPLHVVHPEHSASGSENDFTKPHAPSPPEPFFAAVHALHSSPQASAQQTPSTQNPLAHTDAELQGWPLASGGTHWPPTHTALTMQSAAWVAAVHDAAHAVVAHW
jgi:hypothetical protein